MGSSCGIEPCQQYEFLRGLTELLVGDGQIELRCRIAGLERERLFKLGHALLGFAHTQQHQPKVCVSRLPRRNKVNDFLKVGESSLQIVLRESGGARPEGGVSLFHC